MTWWLMRLLGAAHPALEFDQRTRAELVQMLGIIDAMTAAERAQPQLVGRQRQLRIASGLGTEPSEVSNLLTMQMTISTAARKWRMRQGVPTKGSA